MSDDTITVGVLYPPEWYRDDAAFFGSGPAVTAGYGPRPKTTSSTKTPIASVPTPRPMRAGSPSR